MHSHGHIAALSTLAILFFSSSIASADPGPSAYADAKAPFSDEEIASLTLKLEAASAKKSWKKASKLATEKLVTIKKEHIIDKRETGSPMPTGLTALLSRPQLLDLIRYLSELGKNK